MTKLKRGLALISGAIIVAMTAEAGQVQPAIVDVDLVNMFATGDMVTARTADDDVTFIGCGTRNFELGDGTLSSWAFCQAQDADEELVTCFTFNPELVATIREINDGSFITFGWADDGAGNLTCNRMGFSTQSFYIGKEVKGN